MSANRDGNPSGPSRRGLLKAGLFAGAVAGTGAWSPASASASRSGRYSRLRQPGSLPYPQLPAGTDTIPQIEHIVILMMENHSYDNKLGMLRRRGADGFRIGPDGLPLNTNPYANGDIQHAFRITLNGQRVVSPAPRLPAWRTRSGWRCSRRACAATPTRGGSRT
jgi:phospholipase C